MKESEVRLVLAILRGYSPETKLTPESTKVWEVGIGDLPYPAVEAAVKRWIRERTGFPYPAEIRELVAEQALGLLTPEQAWTEVIAWADRAPGPASYPQVPLVREAVQAIGGIRAVRMSERPDLTRRQFIEAYTARRQETIRTADLSLAALPEGC